MTTGQLVSRQRPGFYQSTNRARLDALSPSADRRAQLIHAPMVAAPHPVSAQRSGSIDRSQVGRKGPVRSDISSVRLFHRVIKVSRVGDNGVARV